MPHPNAHTHGCFSKLGDLFRGVLKTKAEVFGVDIEALFVF